MKAYENVKSHLQPGTVYRRAELLQWSNAVDRHLNEMVDNKIIKKLSGGLYYYPKQSSFGEVPPDESDLVRAFLKNDRFLLMNPSVYNSMGLGTTQLYNETVVYNYKRHGVFELGRQTFRFIKKTFLPSALTEEFMVIELLNNLKKLPEDTDKLLDEIKNKIKTMDPSKLHYAANEYGYIATKKYVNNLMRDMVH